jgi:cytochrome c oxidase cbb3-type subunit 3
MFSRCRKTELFAIALLALAGCQREEREYRSSPLPENGPTDTALIALVPGQAAPAPPDPRGKQYEGNAFHINQGSRLYRWFNCTGCHAAGGGDIGPALMDDEWRYGGSIDQIYSSIMQGRPNGMPSFRGKIPDQQVWQIAAYVRALSGNVPKDAAPSRSETMSDKPPLTRVPAQPPRDADGSANQEPQQ